MWRLLIILAVLIAPAVVFADASDTDVGDDDNDTDATCSNACALYFSCGLNLTLNMFDSIADCNNACELGLRSFGDCGWYDNCPEFSSCVRGFDDDSEDTVAQDAKKAHTRGGCAVVAKSPDLALFLIMSAIGLSAFALGSRSRRRP